jgi:hypothetical protein
MGRRRDGSGRLRILVVTDREPGTSPCCRNELLHQVVECATPQNEKAGFFSCVVRNVDRPSNHVDTIER